MRTAKAKGTAYESAVVKYLTSCGIESARRIVLSGAAGDKGDIWLGMNPNHPSLVIECKNYSKELPYKMVEDFIKEAHTEWKNARKEFTTNYYRALLFVKRPNLGVADSWVIWKNKHNLTCRARLGDIINPLTFACYEKEEDKINFISNIIANN